MQDKNSQKKKNAMQEAQQSLDEDCTVDKEKAMTFFFKTIMFFVAISETIA